MLMYSVIVSQIINQKKGWSAKPVNNINDRLLSELSARFNYTKDELINKVVFYTYGSLNSDLYMKSFSGKLHTVAGEWASIPITSDKDLFDRMVSVGMIMANVEKKTFNIEETMITKLFGSKLLTDFKNQKYIVTIAQQIL